MDIIDEIVRQLGNTPLWENWYIKEKIGSGAFSAVYKVEAVRQSRTDFSALKIEPITADGKIFTDETQKKSTLERKKDIIENESSIMYKLRSCPNIVQYEDELIRELYVNDVFEGYYFLIRMELLTNVYDMMKNGSFDFSERNVMKLALGICQGLKAAHDINIIHRDIKPANFFVSASGEYKLGDFNISKQTTSTRSFAGTDGYIAPEVYRAKTDAFSSYTKQADIYSLGICLYQIMNNGLFPLESDSCPVDDAIDMRMQNHSFDKPVNASSAFAAVIMKACAFDTMYRYQTVDEMIRDINSAMNGNNPGYIPPTNQFDTNRTQYAEDSDYEPYQYQERPAPAPYVPPIPPEPPTTKIQPDLAKNKNSKNVILIIIIVLLLAVVAALAGMMFLGSKEKKSESSGSGSVSPNFAANISGNETVTEPPEEVPEELENSEESEESGAELITESVTEAVPVIQTEAPTENAEKVNITIPEITISDVGSDYGIIITDKDPLNMRSGASKDAEVVYKVPKGEGVDILGESGDWYYASYHNGTSTYTGYLSKEYVQLSYDVSKSDFGIVSTVHDPLNMRKSASKDAEVIYEVPLGAGVKILGEEGDFYYATYEYYGYDYFSVSGYLSKEYVLKSLEITSFSERQCTINSSGVSGYDTRYVALGKRKSTITGNIPKNTKAIAKHMCSSYDVLWYELWSSDGKTYYGWVDIDFLDFE